MLNEFPVVERSFRFSEENILNYYCRYKYDTEPTENIKTQPRTPAFIVAYKIIRHCFVYGLGVVHVLFCIATLPLR